jgi:hypothetical protein
MLDAFKQFLFKFFYRFTSYFVLPGDDSELSGVFNFLSESSFTTKLIAATY